MGEKIQVPNKPGSPVAWQAEGFAPALEAALLPIIGESRLLGVLVHGSAQRGNQDPFSDLDLLAIVDVGGLRKCQLTVDGTSCDITLVGADRLRQLWKRMGHEVNVPLLRAASSGITLLSQDALLSKLQQEAAARLSKGPTPPNESELALMRSACLQTVAFLEKCALRGTHDPMWRQIAIARCGSFLSQLVHVYCQLHGLWSNGFWILIHNDEPAYAEIRRRIIEYLAAADADAQVGVILSLAKDLALDCGGGLT
jgi:hypothetical protein